MEKLAPRFLIGNVYISGVTMSGALGMIDDRVRAAAAAYICVANLETTFMARKDESLCRVQNDAFLTLPDGMPLVWYARLAGLRAVERVTGPDLLLRELESSAQTGYSHYFYGDTPETISKMAHILRERFPGAVVKGMHSPPFRPLTEAEVSEAVEAINSLRPTFVWVGLGAPKQELWMARVIPRIHTSILIGVGAAFRFLIGEYRHASPLVQTLGLEGVYWRFLKRPIWETRWYCVHTPAFVWLLAGMLLRRVVGKSCILEAKGTPGDSHEG